MKFLAAFALSLCVTSAAAATCGPTEDVHAVLTEKYGEEVIGVGILPNNAILEIYANWRSGSFTVLFTDGNGTSCMAASGQDWIELARKPSA